MKLKIYFFEFRLKFLFFYEAPLHIAVKSNDIEIVKLLLNHKDINTDVVDDIPIFLLKTRFLYEFMVFFLIYEENQLILQQTKKFVIYLHRNVQFNKKVQLIFLIFFFKKKYIPSKHNIE